MCLQSYVNAQQSGIKRHQTRISKEKRFIDAIHNRVKIASVASMEIVFFGVRVVGYKEVRVMGRDGQEGRAGMASGR